MAALYKLLVLASILFSLFIVWSSKLGINNLYIIKDRQADIEDNLDKSVPEENSLNLLFGGDVMLGRSVMSESIRKNDFSYPFSKISEFTKDNDIFFVNLENPIIKDCPEINSGFKFCSTSDVIPGLKDTGINVVNIANNHIFNFGTKGVDETKKILNENGIEFTGGGNLVIKDFSGIKLGFLGFDFTLDSPSESDLEVIKNSDSKVNFLVVGIHWGEEYKNKANLFQRSWARKIVASGADIIVGHHPHWIQDFECLNIKGENISTGLVCNGITGKPVYYSLGNLIFDQMWSEETRKGMLIKLTLTRSGIEEEEKINTYMKDVGQPEIVE